MIKVYSWELHERSQSWYIIFWFLISSLIIVSIFSKNIFWALMIAFMVWAYIFYNLQSQKIINMSIEKNWLLVGENLYPWSEIRGFSIEYNRKTNYIVNIVLLTNSWNHIYSLVRENFDIEQFVQDLSTIVPLIWNYEQSFFDILIRKLKI